MVFVVLCLSSCARPLNALTPELQAIVVRLRPGPGRPPLRPQAHSSRRTQRPAPANRMERHPRRSRRVSTASFLRNLVLCLTTFVNDFKFGKERYGRHEQNILV